MVQLEAAAQLDDQSGRCCMPAVACCSAFCKDCFTGSTTYDWHLNRSTTLVFLRVHVITYGSLVHGRRFKAEIAFSGDHVAEKCLQGMGRERIHGLLMQAAASQHAKQKLDNVLLEYGKSLVSSVGAEVDR